MASRKPLFILVSILLVLTVLSDEEAYFEDSELMKYLKEVKFDAETHKAQMKKEISTNLCPELRAGVTMIRDQLQYP